VTGTRPRVLPVLSRNPVPVVILRGRLYASLVSISVLYHNSVLVGKPEGKRPLGRQKRRWVDNIRMDLGEVGWGNVDWIGLAQDRNRWSALVNSVLNLRVP
jgi:hypothetical protein